MTDVSFGIQALISITLSIVFIAISWYALQAFKFDLFFSSPNSARSKILMILLSIVIGHGTATFFLDYLGWSLMLKTLFG